MNDMMLKNIDYLRERANVTYEEAATLLQQHDGDVIAVLVELENQGRTYAEFCSGAPRTSHHKAFDGNEVKEKAGSFLKNASKTRLVIEKQGENGETSTLANISAPIAAGVTLLAPYITLASAAVTLVSGYQVKIKKDEPTENEDAHQEDR